MIRMGSFGGGGVEEVVLAVGKMGAEAVGEDMARFDIPLLEWDEELSPFNKVGSEVEGSGWPFGSL